MATSRRRRTGCSKICWLTTRPPPRRCKRKSKPTVRRSGNLTVGCDTRTGGKVHGCEDITLTSGGWSPDDGRRLPGVAASGETDGDRRGADLRPEAYSQG